MKTQQARFSVTKSLVDGKLAGKDFQEFKKYIADINQKSFLSVIKR